MADYFPLVIVDGVIQEVQSGDYLDIAAIDQSDIDHGSLGGLGTDDDHSIYHTDGRAATWLAANHETTYNHANYDTAYGWGDHSVAGYVDTAGLTATRIPYASDANTLVDSANLVYTGGYVAIGGSSVAAQRLILQNDSPSSDPIIHILSQNAAIKLTCERASGGVDAAFLDSAFYNMTSGLSTDAAVFGVVGNMMTSPTPPEVYYSYIGVYPNNNYADAVFRVYPTYIYAAAPYFYGGTAMTASWNRTVEFQATFPMLVWNSNDTKWAGWGYDWSTGFKVYVNAGSNDVPTGTRVLTLLNGGQTGFSVNTPTAIVHLKAGTTSASTAPLKFTSGSLLTAAEAGAVEFLTDDFYGTITTGTARQKFVLTAGLTATRVPYATTNGRLTDSANLTFDGTTLTATLSYGSMYGNNIALTVTVSVVDTFYQVGSSVTGGSTNGMTFQNSRELKADVAGKYLVTWSMAVDVAAVTNKEVEGAVMINGAAQTNGTSHSEISTGAAGNPDVISGTGIFTLAQNDLISLAVSNHTDTTDVVVDHLSVTAIRVGA